jgi:hypothetical protein
MGSKIKGLNIPAGNANRNLSQGASRVLRLKRPGKDAGKGGEETGALLHWWERQVVQPPWRSVAVMV